MSNNTTDLSSDFDITAVETDAFDKSQLITWASKLELESIDNRTTSIDLMEALSKISKTLTDSLHNVNTHLFQMKSQASNNESRLKDFIQVTLSEELDIVYSRISHLIDKINELQSRVQDIEIDNTKYVETKLKKIQSDQHQFNCLVLEKLTQLESASVKKLESKISTPDMSPINLPKIIQPYHFTSSQITNKPANKIIKTYRKSDKKNSTKMSKQNKRGETLTRRLIMD